MYTYIRHSHARSMCTAVPIFYMYLYLTFQPWQRTMVWKKRCVFGRRAGGTRRIPQKLVLKSIFVGDAFSVRFSTIRMLKAMDLNKGSIPIRQWTKPTSRHIIILRNAATIVNIYNNYSAKITIIITITSYIYIYTYTYICTHIIINNINNN